jgi:hypothetical protein
MSKLAALLEKFSDFKLQKPCTPEKGSGSSGQQNAQDRSFYSSRSYWESRYKERHSCAQASEAGFSGGASDEWYVICFHQGGM